MANHYITEGELSFKMFNLDIEGIRVSFTLDGIDVGSQRWYCDRIEYNLKLVARLAAERAEKALQAKLCDLLGVK